MVYIRSRFSKEKNIIWGTDENRNYKFISRGWSSQLPTVLLPCECILKITSDLKCVIKLGNTLVQKEIFDDEGNLTSIQESLNNNDKNMYLGMTDSAKLYYTNLLETDSTYYDSFETFPFKPVENISEAVKIDFIQLNSATNLQTIPRGLGILSDTNAVVRNVNLSVGSRTEVLLVLLRKQKEYVLQTDIIQYFSLVTCVPYLS